MSSVTFLFHSLYFLAYTSTLKLCSSFSNYFYHYNTYKNIIGLVGDVFDTCFYVRYR